MLCVNKEKYQRKHDRMGGFMVYYKRMKQPDIKEIKELVWLGVESYRLGIV